MQRMPEPEIMDGIRQAEAYANADFTDSNMLFIDLFKSVFPNLTSGSVLDLGCGPANIPIELCKEIPDLKITAVDGSPTMVRIAKDAVWRAGLSQRIEVIEAYLPSPSCIYGEYDAIISKDNLHHLNDPMAFWTDVICSRGCLSKLLIMDLVRPETDMQTEEIVNVSSSNCPRILRDDLLSSLRAAYTLKEISMQLSRVGFYQLQTRRIGSRHFATWGHFRNEPNTYHQGHGRIRTKTIRSLGLLPLDE